MGKNRYVRRKEVLKGYHEIIELLYLIPFSTAAWKHIILGRTAAVHMYQERKAASQPLVRWIIPPAAGKNNGNNDILAEDEVALAPGHCRRMRMGKSWLRRNRAESSAMSGNLYVVFTVTIWLSSAAYMVYAGLYMDWCPSRMSHGRWRLSQYPCHGCGEPDGTWRILFSFHIC